MPSADVGLVNGTNAVPGYLFRAAPPSSFFRPGHATGALPLQAALYGERLGSAAMPDSIWRRIELRVLARGSDYVCTLAGRLNDALLHNEAITDRALRQASVAERPVAPAC